MLPFLIAGAIALGVLVAWSIAIKVKGYLDRKRAIELLGKEVNGKIDRHEYKEVDVGLNKLKNATITKPFRAKPIPIVEHVTALSASGTVYYKGQKIDTFTIECDSVGYDIQVGTILTIKI